MKRGLNWLLFSFFAISTTPIMKGVNYMKQTLYYTVEYHYENVPSFLHKTMREWFMKNRSDVVAIYNKYIDSVNKEWDLTGEPSSFGDYIEDINPKYVKLIQNRIQPQIDLINNRFMFFKYKIDEYGDIIAYIPFIKNSKLWITLKEIES